MDTEKKQSPAVFISYVRENSDVVDRLAQDLRQQGITVWLDRDDIAPGQYWKDAVREAIKNGAFFVACFSCEMNARQETYMHGELRIAIDRLRNMPRDHIWFIPVLINETKLPKHRISDDETIADLNAVELFRDWELGISAILQSMNMTDPALRRVKHLINLIKYYPEERTYALKALNSHKLRKTVENCALLRDEELIAIVSKLINSETYRDDVYSTPCLAASLMRKIGPVAAHSAPALIEALHTDAFFLSHAAARALGEIGSAHPDVVDALIRSLRDMNGSIHREVGQALGDIGPDAAEAIPYIYGAIKEARIDEVDYWGIVKGLAEGLGKIGSPALKYVPTFSQGLCDEDPKERFASAMALGGIGSEADTTIPALIAALKRKGKYARCASAWAIGRMGQSAICAIPDLVNVTGRKKKSLVSECAIEALDSLRAEVPEAHSHILKACNDKWGV